MTFFWGMCMSCDHMWRSLGLLIQTSHQASLQIQPAHMPHEPKSMWPAFDSMHLFVSMRGRVEGWMLDGLPVNPGLSLDLGLRGPKWAKDMSSFLVQLSPWPPTTCTCPPGILPWRPIPQVSARRNKIKSELEIYQGIHQARELQNKKNRHINATITDTLSPRIVVDRIIPIRHTYGVAQQAQAADLQPPTQMKAYKLSTLFPLKLAEADTKSARKLFMRTASCRWVACLCNLNVTPCFSGGFSL